MNTHFLATAVNDAAFGPAQRGRTVPIPETITAVPGYPSKLVLFKMPASRFWQVRCWFKGKTYKRSTHSQSLHTAQMVARHFYAQLSADVWQVLPEDAPLPSQTAAQVSAHIPAQTHAIEPAALPAPAPAPSAQLAPIAELAPLKEHTFAALAERMFAGEQARVERGELARGSMQVLRNRLDAHLLPRWGRQHVADIDYAQLMAFVDYMSKTKSSTTIGQYLVAIRKVLSHGLRMGVISKLPEMPKVKVKTASRGAFTPTEYWRILRTARSLRGQAHPDSQQALRKSHKLLFKNAIMPPDLAWAVVFMVNSFIRPSDLKTLKHRHVEIVKGSHTYLRLTLPETKRHDAPIVTLYPAVRVYRQLQKHHSAQGQAKPDDYLFLPGLRDRNYALAVLGLMFNWVLAVTGFKLGAHGQSRSLYSLRHSAITFRLLYGQGIDLLTLARNARTSVEVINKHYASTLSGEQNIGLLQSRRSRVGVNGPGG